MTSVIKNVGKEVNAWELGAGTEMELKLINEGKIVKDGEIYRLLSQESTTGEVAEKGDFFKVDGKGFPYPNARDWFFKNHKPVGENIWEQLPKPLNAWEAIDEIIPEIQFLIDNKGLKLHPENPEAFFEAPLWGDILTAASDALLIFYSVSYNEDGSVADADFNFVARSEFDATYHYC